MIVSDGLLSTQQTFNVNVYPWADIRKGESEIVSSDIVWETWTNDLGQVFDSYTNYIYAPPANVLISWPWYRTGILQYKTNLLDSVWTDSPTYTNNPASWNTEWAQMAFFRVYETNFSSVARTNLIPASNFSTLTSPFVLSPTSPQYIYQQGDFSLNPQSAGYAVYDFYVEQSGDYIVGFDVLAVDDGSDSFFVDIDSDPSLSNSSEKIFDVAISTTPTFDLVKWRGASNVIDPKVWTLTKGWHSVNIRGREADCRLYNLYIIRY